MNFEKLATTLLVVGGVTLLTVGYFSSTPAIKAAGALGLIFVWYVAYDIIVNRD